MDIVALAAAAAVMGAIIAGLLALYESSSNPRGALDRRLGHLMAESSGLEASAADLEALRPKRVGRVPIISALLEGKSWTEEIALRLEGADLRLTVSEFVAMRIFLGLLLGLAGYLMTGGILGMLLFVFLMGLGVQFPNFYLNYARGRRINKLNSQLGDGLSMIANSLKAGFGLMQSLDMAGKELAHPLATELRRALNDIHIGSSTEEALLGMAKRSGSDDLDIVITAMLVQQSTGGNLAEILDNVGHTMRERQRIRGEIKTLTSQQMLTGVVIGGLPIALAGFISLINPGYIEVLFTETIGNLMLIGAGMLEFFGIMVIRRILAIEV